MLDSSVCRILYENLSGAVVFDSGVGLFMDRRSFFKAVAHSHPDPESEHAAKQRRGVLQTLTNVQLVERITEENIGDLCVNSELAQSSSLEPRPANLDELIGRQPHRRGWGIFGRPYNFWRGRYHRPYYGAPILYPPPPPLLPVPLPVPVVQQQPPPVAGYPYALPPDALLYDPREELPVGWMLLSNGYRVPLGANISRMPGVRIVRTREPEKKIKAQIAGDERIAAALETQNINDYPPYAKYLEEKQRIEADMKATRAEFKRLGKMWEEKKKSERV